MEAAGAKRKEQINYDVLGRKFEIMETNVPKAGWKGKNQSPYPIQSCKRDATRVR
jgi:hypothetical protein